MPEQRVAVSSIQNATATRKRDETVCLTAHSVDSLKETCYRYASRYYSKLCVSDDATHAIVTFNFPSTVSAIEEDNIVSSFHQDLLDQDLRLRVFEQTEVVRNLIFANAFANTSLTEDE